MKQRSCRSTSRNDQSMCSNGELTRFAIQHLNQLQTKYVMNSQFLKAEKIKKQRDSIGKAWQFMKIQRKSRQKTKASTEISADIDLKIKQYKTNWDELFQELTEYFLNSEKEMKQRHIFQQQQLLKGILEADDQNLNQSKQNIVISNYHHKLNNLLKKKQYLDAENLKKTAMSQIIDAGNRSQKILRSKIQSKLNNLKLRQQKQLNFFRVKMEEELLERVKKRDQTLNLLLKKAKREKKQYFILSQQKNLSR